MRRLFALENAGGVSEGDDDVRIASFFILL